MEINTKFDIDDLVIMKYETIGSKEIRFLEVKEIQSNVCYGGTQNFYLCRPMFAHKRTVTIEPIEYKWEISHGIDKEHKGIAFQKYREDELIKLDVHIISELGILK